MRYSFFPGCSLKGSATEYGKSLRYVNERIGLQLVEIEDWNCCGAGVAFGHDLALARGLPERNLALCREQGLGLPIAVPCAACYARLKAASAVLPGSPPVISLLEMYNGEEERQALTAALVKPLDGLKIVCYYGCLYTRPEGGRDAEQPHSMEYLLKLAGAEPLGWDYATECCGAAHHVDTPELCRPLLRDIYRNARSYAAQAIVTACPLCQMNLDMRQSRVEQEYGESFALPTVYFSQLLALALGATAKDAALNHHFTPTKALLARLGEVR